MPDVKIVEHVEENESYSDDALFNINSWGADMSFRELITMYDEDELVKPELQRKYVWTKDEASRFIDSILLGLPVPSIFLAKVGEQKLIIDGYQRILTVYDYVRGIFSGDGKIFRLSNSEVINERWRGKAFAELSTDEQKRIRSSTIHAIIFEQKHPQDDTGMYQIFERINASGRILKSQEIRNCVYHGKFNTFIMDLNKHPSWRKLYGSKEEDSRMADVELVLRFFAIFNFYRDNTVTVKQIALKKYLNDYMNLMNRAADDTLEKYKSVFTESMDLIYHLLGPNAFRNLTKITEKKPIQEFANAFHPAIFDAIGQAAAYVVEHKITIDNTRDFEAAHKSLLNNDEFKDCVSIRTTNVDKIRKRIALSLRFIFGVIPE